MQYLVFKILFICSVFVSSLLWVEFTLIVDWFYVWSSYKCQEAKCWEFFEVSFSSFNKNKKNLGLSPVGSLMKLQFQKFKISERKAEEGCICHVKIWHNSSWMVPFICWISMWATLWDLSWDVSRPGWSHDVITM